MELTLDNAELKLNWQPEMGEAPKDWMVDYTDEDIQLVRYNKHVKGLWYVPRGWTDESSHH